MKTTKKILALLLALAMVFTLAACGEKKEEEQPADTNESTSTEASTTVRSTMITAISRTSELSIM